MVGIGKGNEAHDDETRIGIEYRIVADRRGEPKHGDQVFVEQTEELVALAHVFRNLVLKLWRFDHKKGKTDEQQGNDGQVTRQRLVLEHTIKHEGPGEYKHVDDGRQEHADPYKIIIAKPGRSKPNQGQHAQYSPVELVFDEYKNSRDDEGEGNDRGQLCVAFSRADKGKIKHQHTEKAQCQEIVLAFGKIVFLMQPANFREVMQRPKHRIGKQEELEGENKGNDAGKHHQADIRVIDLVVIEFGEFQQNKRFIPSNILKYYDNRKTPDNQLFLSLLKPPVFLS